MRTMRTHMISRLWLWRGAGAVLALVLCLAAIPIALGAGSAPARLITSSVQDPEAPFRYITVGWIDWAAAHFRDQARRRHDAEAWLLAGLALESSGDWPGALDAYAQGARTAVDERTAGAAWTLLGNLHLRQENLSAAREAFEKALELHPESAQAMYGLGRILERSERPDEAIDWYRKASQRAKEWIEPVVAEAALLIDDRAFVEALVLLRGVEALGTWHAAYHYQLARGYGGLLESMLEGEFTDGAEAAFSELKIEVGRAVTVLKERALHALDRARELSGDDPEVKGLAERLRSL